MNPVQRILGGMNFGPFGDRGAINHDNGNAQVTRGLNLGIGAAPACVFGHQQFDIMFTHQRDVVLGAKRSARKQSGRLGQGQGFGLVHKAQQILMLGRTGKFGQMHASNRQHDIGFTHALQVFCRRPNRWNTVPLIPVHAVPRRAGQRAKLGSRFAAGVDRIHTHLTGKGMGGINHMRHLFGTQILGQSLRTAISADTFWQRLGFGTFHAARIGQGCTDIRLGDQFGQICGFGRSCQDQKVCAHG